MTEQNDIPGSERVYDKKRFYINIINGKFAQKVKEGSPEAEKRITKENKIVWERYRKSLEGMLGSVWLNEGNYGTELLIKLLPNEESEIIIQLNYVSREAQKFLMKINNLNIKQKVKLVPYNFTDDKDKKVIGMNIYQNDVKIADYYTFENPNGYPFPEKDDEGKFVFLEEDDFKILNIQQKKFLKNELEKWRAEVLEQVSEQETGGGVGEAKNTNPTSTNGDDLPFRHTTFKNQI